MLHRTIAQGAVFQFVEYEPTPDIYFVEAPTKAHAAPDTAPRKIVVNVDKRFGMTVRFDPETPMANLALGIGHMADEIAEVVKAEVRRMASKAVSDYLTGGAER
jgi:hypothetical protein